MTTARSWRSRFDPRRGQGLEAVQVGDYVYTRAGTCGQVVAQWWTGPAQGLPARTVVVAEDRGVDEPGEVPYPAEDCVAVHGPHGSSQRCDALHERDGWCHRWAARLVVVWQTDDHGHPVADNRGHQLAGTFAERAVCWEHLPGAVVWAEQRFAPHPCQLRVAAAEGGSTEPPDRADGWDFDVPRRAPDRLDQLRQRDPDRGSEQEGWER
ncbi:MAG: hypothetical protein ACRDZO_11190 [Egibacteraceae bacterium]